MKDSHVENKLNHELPALNGRRPFIGSMATLGAGLLRFCHGTLKRDSTAHEGSIPENKGYRERLRT
jgi:hypothetical protein